MRLGGVGGGGDTTLYHLLTCGDAGVSIDSVPSGGSDAFLIYYRWRETVSALSSATEPRFREMKGGGGGGERGWKRHGPNSKSVLYHRDRQTDRQTETERDRETETETERQR